METNFAPNYAIHPGVILRDCLKTLSMSQKKLSELTGIQKTIINEIINGKRKINGEIAVKLENALQANAKYWMNLQSLYEIAVARIELKEVGEFKASFSLNGFQDEEMNFSPNSYKTFYSFTYQGNERLLAG